MPVANPELRERKRRRLVRKLVAYDPVGRAEPLYQLDHRDQVVAPSSLDRACRELLHRAQAAIGSALDSGTAEVDLPEIVAEATLRRHGIAGQSGGGRTGATGPDLKRTCALTPGKRPVEPHDNSIMVRNAPACGERP
jgi:hypothetical protein